jgi:hypothetical protein
MSSSLEGLFFWQITTLGLKSNPRLRLRTGRTAGAEIGPGLNPRCPLVNKI